MRIAQQILPVDSFENVRCLSTLADKTKIMAAVPQSSRRESNKQRKKSLVRSEGWRASAEFLEIVPRGELKEIISLVRRDVNR